MTRHTIYVFYIYLVTKKRKEKIENSHDTLENCDTCLKVTVISKPRYMI